MQEALCSVTQSRASLASRSVRPEQTLLRYDFMSIVQCGSACACSLAGIRAERISTGTLHLQLLVQGRLASARQFLLSRASLYLHKRTAGLEEVTFMQTKVRYVSLLLRDSSVCVFNQYMLLTYVHYPPYRWECRIAPWGRCWQPCTSQIP